MLTSSTDSRIRLEQEKSGGDRRLMLFELSIGGHYAGYILHLIRYWCEQELTGHLDIVVSPKFLEHHPDVVDAAEAYPENINFVAISPEEEAAFRSRRSGVTRALRAFQEWQIFCKYASLLEASHCLIMYFDTRQLPLALGVQSPCPFSGIYFRPTFHYDTFGDYVPSWKERVQKWREKLLLSRILANPQLRTLFCLDPFVVKSIEQLHSNVKAVYLPDPVQTYSHPENEPEQLKQNLGVQPGRQVFLFFGALCERKGIYQLLEAISLLPPALLSKLCLLFVGPLQEEDRVQIQPKIDRLTQTSLIQILICARFVPDREIQPYFEMSDVILAPYQRHVGMSAILVRAAAAQKPVLGSNYGLMGEMTCRYELGLTVESTASEEIAKGISRFLVESPHNIGNQMKMKYFALQNTAEQYASIIFQHL